MGNDDFRKLGGLWKSDKGYISGTLREQDIRSIIECAKESDSKEVIFFVMHNKKREGKRDPDYRMSCVAKKTRQTQGEKEKIDDDDVPF